MMTERLNSDELLALCGRVRDQEISPEEFARLESLLREDESARHFYLGFMSVCSGLEQFSHVESGDSMEGMSAEDLLDVDASLDWTDEISTGTAGTASDATSPGEHSPPFKAHHYP